MIRTRTFQEREAPCGQTLGGNSYRDQDDEALLTHRVEYSCGCISVRH